MAKNFTNFLSAHLARLGLNKLHANQELALGMIDKGVDSFVVLPTGSGKSLLYQLSPFLSDPGNTVNKVVVVMPLTALMDEQLGKLTAAGYCAAIVSDYETATRCLGDGSQFLILSPEVLCDVFLKVGQDNPSALRSISHVFIDESHCVAVWGTGHKGSRAFRAKYAAIGDFRSVCPTAVYIAMTATATHATEIEICQLLQMTNYGVVRESPEKCNVRYSVTNIKGDIADGFQWLVDDFAKAAVCKTLIFFKDLNSLGAAYSYLHNRCPPDSIAMFHGHSSQFTKRRVVTEFCRGGSSILKVVLCSSAFSMGLDIPDIRLVVHYGVPYEADQYLQETGRAGRDGLSATAIIIRHDTTLAGGKVGKDMKRYLSTEECRRSTLLSVFGATPSATKGFLCCDNCAKKTCCSCSVMFLCNHIDNEHGCYCVKWCGMLFSVERLPVSKATDIKNAIRQNLTASEYTDLEIELSNLVKEKRTLPDNVNTVYPDLIKSIIDNFIYIDSVTDILNLGAYNLKDAEDIYGILDQFFEA